MSFSSLFSKKVMFSALAVVAVGGIAFAMTREPEITYETLAADRGPVVQEVSVTGSIAPFKRIDLQPEVVGRVTVVHVTEGDEVVTGDVLIELDARDVQSRIASQRAAVDSARARLAEAVAGATPQEVAASEAAVATARSRRDAAISAEADAQITYANAVSRADAQMAGKLDAFLLAYGDAVTAATDAIDRLSAPLFTTDNFLTFTSLNAIAETNAIATRTAAKAKLVHLVPTVATVKLVGTSAAALDAYAGIVSDLVAVKTHLEAARTVLSSASGISSSTLATYQANVGSAIASVDATLQTLAAGKASVDLQTQVSANDIANAQAALSSAAFAVDTAEKSLLQAQADLSLRTSGSRPEAIASQRALVAAEEAALSGLLTELSKRRILSPLDGVITRVGVEPGETAQPSVVAVTVNGKGRFEIVANVSEVDIAKIAIQQPVRITLDAFPISEIWTGTIAFIDPAEKVLEGVIFYQTKVVFDVEDERLRSGMTANLSIEAARRDDVVRVPLRALRERDGKTYVEVLTDGAPVEREVTLGIENNQHAEVISGLSEGELVVTGTN